MISLCPWNADVYPSPSTTWCRVCGEAVYLKLNIRLRDHRCWKHRTRNPCAIEGCKRTMKAPESGRLSCDDYLCGQHWRELVPVGSPERRIYNRFFRRAKKHEWQDEGTCNAFWRFWRRLVSRARARAAGDVDVREINRIMGW